MVRRIGWRGAAKPGSALVEVLLTLSSCATRLSVFCDGTDELIMQLRS
jgi:hypothetical protein